MTHADRLTLLQTFCSTDSMEGYLRRPFVLGEYAYATNRHWMLRMPHEGLGELQPWQRMAHPKNLEQMFEKAPWTQLRPMALVEHAQCSHCDGLGQIVEEFCPACNGEGAFTHHGKEYDCQTCAVTGVIARKASPLETPNAKCQGCSGTGFEFPKRGITSIQHQGAWFQAGYLAFLSRLPGIQFGVEPTDPYNPHHAAAFRCDFGEGPLQPTRAPSESIEKAQQ